jgi:hypothetical protein
MLDKPTNDPIAEQRREIKEYVPPKQESSTAQLDHHPYVPAAPRDYFIIKLQDVPGGQPHYLRCYREESGPNGCKFIAHDDPLVLGASIDHHPAE